MRGGENKGRTQFARMLKELNIKQNLAKALTVQYNNAIYAISQVRAIRTLRKKVLWYMKC